MPPKAPAFWSRGGHPLGLVLSPLGGLYELATRLRFAATRPYRSRLPVVCIGNFTLGGAGKTPLAIELCRLLQAEGRRPAFLTRGYGGTIEGPHLYDPATDSAAEVGDEPLLLGRNAPVVISRDRPAGARLIESLDVDLILMDDGFQNPTLHKDLSLIVVDGLQGLGNGRVFPAGPLRASLGFQLPRADAVVVSGGEEEGDAALAQTLANWDGLRLQARILPAGDQGWLRGARVLAVSGIAHPAKFHRTLKQAGAEIAAKRDFPDHHAFSEEQAEALLRQAGERLTIVMTEKDWVRLPETGARGRLKRFARTLPIRLEIDRPDALLRLLRDHLPQATV